MIDPIQLLILQTLSGYITFLVTIIVTYTVLHKDRSYILNQAFAVAIMALGLSSWAIGTSNLPYFVKIVGYDADAHMVFFIRLFYSFLVISLIAFFFVTLILESGNEIATNPFVITSLFLVILMNILVIILPDSIYVADISVGNTETSLLFKVVFFGSAVILYFLTFNNFYTVYKQTEGNTREGMKIFMIGWVVGGLALVLSVFSDFMREIDLVSQVLLAIGVIILSMGFKNSG